jgi:hypothetical protein
MLLAISSSLAPASAARKICALEFARCVPAAAQETHRRGGIFRAGDELAVDLREAPHVPGATELSFSAGRRAGTNDPAAISARFC